LATLPPSLTRAALSPWLLVLTMTGTARQRTRMMHSQCLASTALPVVGACGDDTWWNSVDTAHAANWVSALTTISCLDSVKAKYLDSVMAAAGSEAEGEAGVGL